MADEQMMAQPAVNPNEQAPIEWEEVTNWEDEIISQIIQMIAGLSAESQRQLMGFLNEQFSGVIQEEEQEYNSSPEELERKADVMSEAF